MINLNYFCTTLNTDKKHIQHLATICQKKGVKYAIISPGSRCAPLIVAFNRIEGITCYSIIDERSAAFVALGIAQQTKSTVALICTSGSAVLNYAPALAEAFYQKIPLLVLSADRPNEWIDQGENQSINQVEVYKNYIKKSYQLPVQVNTEKDLWFSDRIVSEALNTCQYPDFGPVHINIPLREPLYNLTDESDLDTKIIEFEKPSYSLDAAKFEELAKYWEQKEKILIVVGGFKSSDAQLSSILNKIGQHTNVVILKESISNVYGADFIDQIDANVELIDQHNLEAFTPELVVTFGSGVVSKKLKFWLRKQQHVDHWHITSSFEHWDIFQSLAKIIQMSPTDFLDKLATLISEKPSSYKAQWQELNNNTRNSLARYLADLPFCDFTLFDYILKQIPQNSLLQLGNSTPVRYANLMHIDGNKNIQINSNRGVSGIDGVISTAAGASMVDADKLCFCICGDVATLYDSNALLNASLKANFKLIVINNQGGNIFKIIPGPSKLNELEQYFETKHNYEFADLAAMHKFAYFSVAKMSDLESTFSKFVQEDSKSAFLEIKTNNQLSADALKNYFDFIKEDTKID